MPKEDHYLKTKLVNNQTSIAILLSVQNIVFYQIHINCLPGIGNVGSSFVFHCEEISYSEKK